jgi:predicted transcriptional regulator
MDSVTIPIFRWAADGLSAAHIAVVAMAKAMAAKGGQVSQGAIAQRLRCSRSLVNEALAKATALGILKKLRARSQTGGNDVCRYIFSPVVLDDIPCRTERQLRDSLSPVESDSQNPPPRKEANISRISQLMNPNWQPLPKTVRDFRQQPHGMDIDLYRDYFVARCLERSYRHADREVAFLAWAIKENHPENFRHDRRAEAATSAYRLQRSGRSRASGFDAGGNIAEIRRFLSRLPGGGE